jgi:hypothetical protein
LIWSLAVKAGIVVEGMMKMLGMMAMTLIGISFHFSDWQLLENALIQATRDEGKLEK